MFAVIEVGQAVMPSYGWLDAAGGIISEAIYFPLAAILLSRLFPDLQEPSSDPESGV